MSPPVAVHRGAEATGFPAAHRGRRLAGVAAALGPDACRVQLLVGGRVVELLDRLGDNTGAATDVEQAAIASRTALRARTATCASW